MTTHVHARLVLRFGRVQSCEKPSQYRQAFCLAFLAQGLIAGAKTLVSTRALCFFVLCRSHALKCRV
jgi:hypothetical protein